MSDQNHSNKYSNFNDLSTMLLRTKHHKHNGDYTSFIDTQVPEDIFEHVHQVVPIQKNLVDHLKLVKKARKVIQDYLTMKGFILDIFVKNISQQAGLSDQHSQKKVRDQIENEMNETLEKITMLSANIGKVNGSSLEKDLVYNELNSLIHDLTYRLKSYQRHYQSYLADLHYETN